MANARTRDAVAGVMNTPPLLGGFRSSDQLMPPLAPRPAHGDLCSFLSSFSAKHPGSEPPLPTRGRTRRTQSNHHLWKRKFSARDFRPHSIAPAPGAVPCPVNEQEGWLAKMGPASDPMAVVDPELRVPFARAAGSFQSLALQEKTRFPFERERVCVCVAVRESCGAACEPFAPTIAPVRGSRQ